MGEGSELTKEEEAAREAWKIVLEEWYSQYEKQQINRTIADGRRYRVMMDLRKELTEKVRSSHFQSHAPDEPCRPCTCPTVGKLICLASL
jgi:glutamyl-tRNA reductase